VTPEFTSHDSETLPLLIYSNYSPFTTRIAARVAANGLYTRCPLEHRLKKFSHALAPSTVSCAKHILSCQNGDMICIYGNQKQSRCVRHTWRDQKEYLLMPNNEVSKLLCILCSTVKAVKAGLLQTYVLDA
jgi:hypothetical protein